MPTEPGLRDALSLADQGGSTLPEPTRPLLPRTPVCTPEHVPRECRAWAGWLVAVWAVVWGTLVCLVPLPSRQQAGSGSWGRGARGTRVTIFAEGVQATQASDRHCPRLWLLGCPLLVRCLLVASCTRFLSGLVFFWLVCGSSTF